MTNKKKIGESEKDKAWRQGYETGVKTVLRQNNDAIRIGEAILKALDNRYEFRKEDY